MSTPLNIAHNADLVFQATLLRSFVVEKGGGPLEMTVLMLLASRMFIEDEVDYPCYSNTIGNLAEELGICTSSIRKGVKFLVVNGILGKEIRQYYYGFCVRLTPMWEGLPHLSDPKAVKKLKLQGFYPLGGKAMDSTRNIWEEDGSAEENVYSYLKAQYRGHVSFHQAGAQAMFTRLIARLLPTAGSADTMIDILHCLSDDQEEALRNSRKLGAFLKTTFPIWLREYREKESAAQKPATPSTATHTPPDPAPTLTPSAAWTASAPPKKQKSWRMMPQSFRASITPLPLIPKS